MLTTAGWGAAALAATADLAISKTDGQSTAAQGQSLTYTVVVTNLGPDAVVGAAVADNLPNALEGVSWTCVATPGSSCGAAGTGDLADSLSLLAGGTATYSLTGTIASTATGSLVNTATVVSPAGTGDPVPGNNSATDVTDLTPLVDLGITKSDGRSTATPGSSTTYTVTVSNAGPATATGATVADAPPASLACSWTCVPSGGSSCSAGPLVGDLADTVTIPATARVTYTGVCAIDPGATGGLSNSASVTAGAGTTELALGDNLATDATSLEPAADLAVSIDDGIATAVPGGPDVVATLEVSNDGPSDVVGAVVQGTFASQLTGVTWTCLPSPGASCTANGVGDVLDTVDLAAGSSFTYVVTGGVPSSATGTLVNGASVATPATVIELQPVDNTDTDTTLLTPQADLAVSLDDGTATAIPGESTVYTLTVTNGGPSDATGSQVTATPDDAASCTWTCVASPGASCTAGPIVGDLADTVQLPAAASLTYSGDCAIDPAATGTLSTTATVGTGAGVVELDPSDDQATDLTTLEPTADLRITKTDGRTTAVPGESLTYTLEVDNQGPSTAQGARVQDTVPATLDCLWTCVAGGGGSCTTGQQAGDLDDPVTLPPLATLVYTGDCTVAPDATGTLANTAMVVPPSGVVDPFPADATASDLDTVLVPTVDLAITKSDGLATVSPGESLTYTLEVSNAGPSNADGAQLTDTLPTVLDAVSWSCVASAGSSCPAAGSGDLAETVSVAAGGSLTVTIEATLRSDAAATLTGNPLSNTATIAAPVGTTDNQASNDTATDLTTLAPRADLALSKDDGQTSAVPGESLTTTLVARNDGPGEVLGARLTDFFPDELENVSWTCLASPGSSCPAAGVGDLDVLVDLAVAGTATFTVEATIRPDATGTLANTAQLEAPDGVSDPDPSNDTASDVDTVLTPIADLRLSKDDGVEAATPGGALTYTLVLVNDGPSDSPATPLVDPLPAGLTCTWDCVASGGATCPATLPAGILSTTVDLPAGSQATLSAECTLADDLVDALVNTASASPPPGVVDPTPEDASASHTTPLEPRAELVVTKTDGRNTVAPGEVTTYTVVATNLGGPSLATGATVVDNFPDSLDCTWTCLGTGGASCAQGQSVGPILDVVDLPPGGTATYTADCTVAGEAEGAIVNTVTLTPPAGLVDSNPSNNSALDSTTVEPRVDLAISKSDGVTLAIPGETVVYTVVASNAFGPPVVGARVRDDFPSSLSCTWGCVGNAGGVCTPGQVVGSIDDLVDLPAGASVTYTASCLIDPAATGILANTATVEVPVGSVDPDPSNNTASDLDTVLQPRADLAISKTDGTTQANPGGEVTYTVVVDNPGPSAVVDLRVEDSPPSELDCLWTCATTNGAVCDPAPQSGDLVDLPDLPAGSSVTYTGVCGIDGEAVGTLANTASLTPPPGFDDPNPGNDTATDDDTALVLLADLSVSLDDGVSSAIPGTEVTYTLVARHDPAVLFTPLSLAPVIAPRLRQPVAAVVVDDFPTELACSWTCVATPGSACTPGPVSGDLVDSPSLESGGSATYTAVCALASSATGSLTNTASISAPFGVADLDPSNDVAEDVDLLTPTVDLVVSKTDGATEEVPGSTVAWTVTAQNPGPSDAPGTLVRDLVGSESQCLWSCVGTGGATCLPGQLAGDLLDTANLPAGSTATYTGLCTLDPDATGTLANTAEVFAAAGITELDPNDDVASDLDTLLVPTADLVLSKTDGRTTATPGDEVVYTVVVENPIGPSTLRGVRVDDVPPPELDCLWSCEPSAGASCSPGQVAGPLSDFVDLPPGASTTYTMVCAIDPAATGTLVNTASLTVAAGSVDPEPGNDNASDDDTVLVPEADLVLTKTDGTEIAVPGATVTYTLEVSNLLGPSSIQGVGVSDPFPASLDCTWTCTPEGGAICTAGPVIGDLADTVDLPAGSWAVYTAVCTVDPAATGTLLNQATLTLPDGALDPDPNSNQASDLDTLEPRADLVITKSDGVSTAIPGEPLAYSLELRNDGPSDAPGSQVEDRVPAGLDCLWTCQTLGGATCDPGPHRGDLSDQPDLPVGSNIEYLGQCEIDPAASGTLSNTAIVATSNTVFETDPSDNHATDDDTVLTPQADLSITKSDGKDSAVPGETVLYTLGVGNAGPSHATEVTVRDLFPPELTCSWSCSSGDPELDCEPGPVDGDLVDLVSLPPGAQLTYVAACVIDANAEGEVSNTATIEGAAGLDPNLADNSATDVDLLSDVADLAVLLTDDPDPVAPGESLAYGIEITNLGPVRETRVVVSDLLPDAVTLEAAFLATEGLIFSDGFESGDLAAWNGGLAIVAACDDDAGTVTCDLGALGVSETVVLVLVVRVDADASGTLINSATVDGDGSDPNSSNDTAVELTTVDDG